MESLRLIIIQIMQDIQHLKPSNGFVDRLFSASSIDEHIEILKREGMIQYLSCKDFCERIRQYIQGDKIEEFITLLKKQIIAQKRAHPDENYHFPFIRQEEKFMKVVLDTFIVEYLYDRMQDIKNEQPEEDQDEKEINWSEREVGGTLSDQVNNLKEINRTKSRTFRKGQETKQFKQRVNSQQNTQNQLRPQQQNKSINEYSNSNIFKFDFQCEVIDQSKFQEDLKAKKEYDQKTLKKNEKQIQNIINPQQKIKKKQIQKTQQLLKLDLQVKDKAIIPNFLTQRQQAFSMLLQVNLTAHFSQVLNQIKNMIKKQIQQNTVLPFYQQFFSQYLQFKLISQGKCEQKIYTNDKRMNQILKQMKQYWGQRNRTIKYLPGKRQSYHLKVWECIYLQLNRQKKMYKFISDINKTGNYLLTGLEKIYLSFKFKFNTSMIYGLTKNRNIFINLNVKQKSLNLKQFVQGPLKPYIALTIYHELAHFLIRSYNFEQDRASGQSFKVCHSTIGQKILQSFYKQYSGIPQYLKLSSTQVANADKSQSDIKKHASIIFNFLQIENQTIEIIQKVYQKVEKLIQKVQIIKDVVDKSITSLNKINIKQKQYQDLTSYIDDLSKSNEQTIIDTQKQLKYSVFFSLFLIPWIHDRFFKPKQIDKAEYQSNCHKIVNPNIKRYFQKQNLIIQAFSKILFKYLEEQSKDNSTNVKKTIEFEQLYRKFANLMLKNQVNQVNFINRQIDQISSLFHKGLLNNFNRELKCLLMEKLYNFKTLFSSFKLTLFEKLNDQNMLSKFINKLILFNDIVDAYQSYYKVMNFIKYYQFLIISTQIPSFYTHNLFESQKEKQINKNSKRNSLDRKLEAGFDMERRLFPTLVHTQIIYAKDYHYMKTINTQSSRYNIGKMPITQQQKRQNIFVTKNGNQIERGMLINVRACGTHRYKYANKALNSRIGRQEQQQENNNNGD